MTKVNRRKASLTIILVFSLTLIFANNALAQTSNPESEAPQKAKILSYEYAAGSLTNQDMNLLSQDLDLATKRAEKDAKYLVNKAEQILNSQMNSSAQIGITAVQTVYLGTDKNLTSFNVGNSGGNKSGLADYACAYGISGKWADDSVSVVGVGDASAWSWVGPQINVSGSQGNGQYAWIKFNGSAYGNLVSGYGGSSNGRVRVSVWDYTRGTEVGGYTVWDQTSSNNSPKTCNVSFSPSFRVYLEAGHTYALRFGLATSGSLYGTVFTGADFWNNGSGGDGLDGSSVYIDF